MIREQRDKDGNVMGFYHEPDLIEDALLEGVPLKGLMRLLTLSNDELFKLANVGPIDLKAVEKQLHYNLRVGYKILREINEQQGKAISKPSQSISGSEEHACEVSGRCGTGRDLRDPVRGTGDDSAEEYR